MQVISGPFHPYLEDRLVEEILREKQADPLCPLLVLVPSDSLRRRLKRLLARERRLSFLNIHLMTFHQLSLRLFEETEGPLNIELCDDAFLEEILRQLLRMGLPGTAPFAGLEEKAGGCAALWQTLRDLKDGAVNPDTVLEAVRSDLFGEDSGEGPERLFTLFRTFSSFCEKWNLRDYSDLDLIALERVPSSPYLKRFQRIFYYGFYDLTQVQLDVFRSVATQYPVTLLFPLIHGKPAHPAWTFADRFYERYIHGMGGGSSPARDTAAISAPAREPLLSLFAEEDHRPGPASDALPVTIFSCFNGREEIDTVAKEILRLVSEEKYSFEEIGVVGRTLAPYLPWIKEIFSHHSIPVTSSAEEPLIQHPLAKAALLLIHLPLKGYLRSHVIDLLDSPYFNGAALSPEKIAPRADLWDLVTRWAGISKGIEEWRRLENYLARDIVAGEGDDEESEPKKITVPAHQVRALWRLFNELHGDLAALPQEASWSRYIALWKELQKKWLKIDPRAESDRSSAPQAEVVAEILERLSALDVVPGKISLTYFLETYRRWLERPTAPFAGRKVPGVAVLDAMAARGLSFRALFLIGLNEGLFPRTIREDAFLRDRERELLETALGYKVATKLGGFDEERLLFTLLVGAAGERLYGLHQRNDESGRPQASSWYLEELCRALGKKKIQRIVVPRGAVEKSALAPFRNIEYLPPEELAVRWVLTGRDPTPLVERCLPHASLYRHGAQVIRQLEAITDRLAEHDGMAGPLADNWQRIAERGLSATSLEAYARCPFQFFARNLLGLERLERPEEASGPGPADVGRMIHSILKSFYQELLDRKFFLSDQKSETAGILEAATERCFAAFERERPVGYPISWEILREGIAALLKRAVALDLQELRESGYRPAAFEREADDRLPESWPGALSGLAIRGRMDRVDYQPEQNRYRVIDYKLKMGNSRQPPDRDLLRAALRGQRLQPPFYLLLGKKIASRLAAGKAEAPVDSAFYFLAPQWAEGPLLVERLAAGAWEGGALKETVAFLVEAIRRGLFFIQPGDHCRFCEVSEACRRNHRPTLWRVERDPRSRAHSALKDKKADRR